MIQLVIADDHAIVRGGLKQIFALVPDFEVVGEAINGSEVLECLRHAPFDLLLLDLNMPGISGADLITRIRAHRADLPVLVLSMHNEPQVAARMLKAGASGYITKDCEPDILLAAIRKVSANGKYIDPDLAEKMVFDVTSTALAPLHSRLSDRELEVFRLLTTGKCVNEIAKQLAISNKTVSTHKVRLMVKMNLTSMADLMRYAMQHDIMG
ncbi:response regulator [Rhodoferax sp. UBA5149]|uniref:response regulator n=1 Tax=Rhodoferax sp. UBA5149 TaxID=1947379 RepID=UPI0026006D7D|nr:response regulator transcription factor [Rhodoferax sp. UBA5149]